MLGVRYAFALLPILVCFVSTDWNTKQKLHVAHLRFICSTIDLISHVILLQYLPSYGPRRSSAAHLHTQYKFSAHAIYYRQTMAAGLYTPHDREPP